MIQEEDVEGREGVADDVRLPDIALPGGGIPGGMVMDQDN